MVLAFYAPPVGLISNQCKDVELVAGVESALSASSEEAEWSGAAGTVVPCDPEAPSDLESSSKPDALSDSDV